MLANEMPTPKVPLYDGNMPLKDETLLTTHWYWNEKQQKLKAYSRQSLRHRQMLAIPNNNAYNQDENDNHYHLTVI